MPLPKGMLPVATLLAGAVHQHAAAKHGRGQLVGSLVECPQKAIPQQTGGVLSQDFLHEESDEKRTSERLRRHVTEDKPDKTQIVISADMRSFLSPKPRLRHRSRKRISDVIPQAVKHLHVKSTADPTS